MSVIWVILFSPVGLIFRSVLVKLPVPSVPFALLSLKINALTITWHHVIFPFVCMIKLHGVLLYVLQCKFIPDWPDCSQMFRFFFQIIKQARVVWVVQDIIIIILKNGVEYNISEAIIGLFMSWEDILTSEFKMLQKSH